MIIEFSSSQVLRGTPDLRRCIPEGKELAMELRALIIADDSSMHDLLGLIVSRRGHHILSSDHISAGDMTPCCDILVCDSEDLLNGTIDDLQAMLRQCATTPENTVLFAGSDMKILKDARALGCRIITKPFRLGTIFDWLDERARSIGRPH